MACCLPLWLSRKYLPIFSQPSINKHEFVGRQQGLGVAVANGSDWLSERVPAVRATVTDKPGQVRALALGGGATIEQKVRLADALGVVWSQAALEANRAATAPAFATMNSLLSTKSCCKGTVVSTRPPLVILGSGKSKRRSIQARSCRLIAA